MKRFRRFEVASNKRLDGFLQGFQALESGAPIPRLPTSAQSWRNSTAPRQSGCVQEGGQKALYKSEDPGVKIP
jgi:hypothetical protein